jgi:tryptophan synthase alpha chain
MREAGINVPILLMGYINPVIQFGVENFCQKCQEVGVDGLILPDMPASVYEEEYKAIFDKYGILNTFLITPQTTDERIRHIDNISDGFIYMVSSASTTGAKSSISVDQEAYFARLIGFGISDNETFKKAASQAAGAIIGSAFIKLIGQSNDLAGDIKGFVSSVKNG